MLWVKLEIINERLVSPSATGAKAQVIWNGLRGAKSAALPRWCNFRELFRRLFAPQIYLSTFGQSNYSLRSRFGFWLSSAIAALIALRRQKFRTHNRALPRRRTAGDGAYRRPPCGRLLRAGSAPHVGQWAKALNSSSGRSCSSIHPSTGSASTGKRFCQTLKRSRSFVAAGLDDSDEDSRGKA